MTLLTAVHLPAGHSRGCFYGKDGRLVRTREASLKPEYQDWYPWVKPGLWYRARWLTELVLRQRQSIEPRWEAEFRVPSDRHFTFRGGPTGRGEGTQTRHSDIPEAYRVLRIPRPSRPEAGLS